MEYILINEGKLKVMFEKSDLEEFDIRAEELDYANPDAKPVFEDILRYAYRESKYPEVSNIRTHISIINKKFRNLSNRNLIEMTFGTGYRILTPEVASALV